MANLLKVTITTNDDPAVKNPYHHLSSFQPHQTKKTQTKPQNGMEFKNHQKNPEKDLAKMINFLTLLELECCPVEV